ncbi:hypothetical protein I2492_19420 [Budviciaceae bacterium CWB-B4]|uniref:Uncharacterized protein n=1 Tax=Limnobaculum xujianqingii TaxID=2738837 RepID=A0A9D7ALJ7_9GAMM|nr:hypothetical protein [Limnobaculum xujianqingii]MBK5075171.1 hypothetical protein [Limnobaculum xujianqingii]MBK5178481.1 hypothetical protein [Limnobaculum xujianqingii]
MTTNVKEVFSDLDAGIFENKIGVALSEVAQGVLKHRQKGSVTIEINLEAMNEMQVMLSHKLKFSKPTSRGKSSEEDTTHTPMYVGRGGKLSLQLEDQGQLFGKDGKVVNLSSAVN